MDARKKSIALRIIAIAVFVVMAVEIFLLAKQNRTLKAEIKRLRIQKIEHIEIGIKAPDFVLHTIEGREVKLSDYWGRNLILIFFSTGCSPCLMDIPNWKRLADLESDTLHVLGISQGDPEEIEAFVISYDLDFEVAVDPDGKVKELYKCGGVPQKILINNEGIVTHVETRAVPHTEKGEILRRMTGYR